MKAALAEAERARAAGEVPVGAWSCSGVRSLPRVSTIR